MSDVEHVRWVMNNQQNYRFSIVPLSRGPADNKRMRIETLQAPFESHRIWMPRKLMQPMSDGTVRDVIYEFIEEEYKFYPIVQHDDGLDCLADIMDVPVVAMAAFPMARAFGTSDAYHANTTWKPF